MVVEKTAGTVEVTEVRTGEYDQQGRGAWLTLEMQGIEDPQLLDEYPELVDAVILVVVDRDSVFTCVDGRKPLWMGGPRREWALLADMSGVYSDAERDPFPWQITFDLLIADTDLIVNVEELSTDDGGRSIRVAVEPEVLTPVVAGLRIWREIGEAKVDLGDPVDLIVEVDRSGYISTIGFEADAAAGALMSELAGTAVPSGHMKYRHTLTLEKLTETRMPVVDTSAASCPL